MTSCVHKMCGRTYGQTNIVYRFHGWMIFARVIALFMFVWPYVHSHILCTQLVICLILFIFGILIGHDLGMRILCRFHGWLIFARLVALFMFVWPYVRPHILCTQLVICLLLDFIYIWYLGWPWSEHAHIIPISRMVDFCANCPRRIPTLFTLLYASSPR
jgi:hypothetical protein